MPNIQVINSPQKRDLRFRVKATGETGTAVSSSNGTSSIGRLASIGSEWNVRVIDICIDDTGEIRSFRADHLEDVRA